MIRRFADCDRFTRRSCPRRGAHGPGIAVLLGVALSLALMTAAPAAQAAETVYGKVGEFGEAGTGNGQFTKPEGIAVDPKTGDIFVADTENHRVQVFQPTATGAAYLTQFGSGVLSRPVGVAVDPTTGAVYVEDAGLNEIVKYDQTPGAPPTFSRDASFVSPAHGTAAGEIGSFGETTFFGALFGGIAVDPTVDPATGTHDILVADPANKLIERFTSNGTFIKSFDGLYFKSPVFVAAFSKPVALAVNSAGDVIVADVNSSAKTSRVLLYNGAGEYLATLGPVPNGLAESLGIALGSELATDQTFVTSKPPPLIAEPGAIYRFSGPAATPPDSEIDHFEVGNHGVFSGIAVRPASGSIHARLYAIAGIETTLSPRRVLVFEALTPPEVAIEPASAITATSATFHGTVNPEGSDAKWQFEYRPHGAPSWVSVPIPDGDAGAGETVVKVQAATEAQLEPNTEYEVRLHATNNAGATSRTSSVTSFTTKATPPVVDTQAAGSIGDTGATLIATVNPRNSEVIDCHFEWGSTTAYGHTAPCANEPGSGGAPVYVTAELSGLSPTSTYHFRIVATNTCKEGCGTSQGEDSTFATRSAAEAAIPQRGYELVSAIDTNGLEAQPDSASPNGDHFAYWVYIPPPGVKNGQSLAFFTASRESDGSWSQAPVAADTVVPAGRVFGTGAPLFSEDLTVTAFTTEGALSAEDQNGVRDVYLYDAASGAFTWVSRDPEIPAGTPQTDTAPVGQGVRYLSPHGHRVLFQSTRRLLSAAVEGVDSLYEWDEGRLSLVAIPPESSSGFTGESALGSSGFTFGEVSQHVTADAVSRDGARVVFEAREGSAPPQLYVRLDGEKTLYVSKPARGVTLSGPPAAVEYWGADAEDGTIFFTSSSPLTANSTAPGTNEPGGCSGNLCDLYAYDVASESLRDLTPAAGGGGVERVFDVSEDGSRIYFTSSKRLNRAGELTETALSGESLMGAPGGPNLYLAELAGSEVKLSFIATVEPGEPAPKGHIFERFWETAADPSGELLAFRSAAPLVPGRSTGGLPQVFVYDATRHELSCASCPGDGAPATAEANLSPSSPNSAGNLELVAYVGYENGYAPRARNVTPDGAVYFQTASALVDGATNGMIDVYEWRGGNVGLVSSGTAGQDAMFGDATAGSSTASGATVFFRSGASLVAGAEAGVQHIYAARVGGGYHPPTPALPCSGGECRGPLSSPPSVPVLGSTTFAGAGNMRPKAQRPRRGRGCSKGEVRRHGRCISRKRLVREALRACARRHRHNRRGRRECTRRVRARFAHHAHGARRGRDRRRPRHDQMAARQSRGGHR